MSTTTEDKSQNDVLVEPISNADDVVASFECVCEAFGRQTADGIFIAFTPGWDTPEGKASGALRFRQRWEAITTDRNGNPNTVFLKATLPSQETSGRGAIVGMAIWVQASNADGYGDAPAEDVGKVMDLEALYPNDAAEQRYVRQLDSSLHGRRIQFVKEIATSASPSVMVLDLCAVDPALQGRGIGKKLTEWGLREAERRGGLESITEASSAGRHVYKKLGFQQEGGEIEYEVEEQFKARERPSNIFMRKVHVGH